MRTSIIPPAALILALLGAGAARAEDPPELVARLGGTPRYTIPNNTPTETLRPYGDPPRPPDPSLVPAPGLSDWITYHRPDCCGPLGGGLISYELYVRAGPSLPVAGGLLHSTLDAGWLIQGGARTLFFNPAGSAAWAVDVSISNTFNNSNRPNIAFPLNGNLVTVRDLTRTGINLGLGREWYLLGNAHSDGINWRVGADVGGRYATARLNLNDFVLVADAAPIANGYRRRNDVIGGAFVSWHSDLELPLGGCKLLAGFRCEWDYTWIDLIHHTTNDISDLNFLATLGIRF